MQQRRIIWQYNKILVLLEVDYVDTDENYLKRYSEEYDIPLEGLRLGWPIQTVVMKYDPQIPLDSSEIAEPDSAIPFVWIEHSVNCYYCGDLIDERECLPADSYNNNDGGSICPKCMQEKTEDDRSY